MEFLLLPVELPKKLTSVLSNCNIRTHGNTSCVSIIVIVDTTYLYSQGNSGLPQVREVREKSWNLKMVREVREKSGI